jgi:DNA-binding response OmpR family regulator
MFRHKQILLIGSADPMAGIPYQALPRRWYRVAIVADDDEALQRLRQDPPDLVLLDATLPHNDTAAVCAVLQDQNPPIPLIIFAKSRSHVRQLRKFCAEVPLCVTLVKPCTPTGLTSTVSKLVRRVRQRRKAPPVLYAGPLAFDLARRQVTKNEQIVALTPKQYDLLLLLVRHTGEVVSRQSIMEEVWQTSWMGDTRTLDVHIRMIRRNIEDDPSRPKFVRTMRGRGYVFQVPEPEDEEPS